MTPTLPRPIRGVPRWLALAAAACSGDAFSFGEASVRALALVNAPGGIVLVEYAAPPLIERRRMPAFTPDSGMYVLLRDGSDGGFYAMRFAGAFTGSGAWELVRFDGDWRVAASRSRSELVDTTSLIATPHLLRTPDRQHLIVAINAIQSARTLLVLDPITLAVVNRTGRPPPLVLLGTTGATGSQVMLASIAGCPVSLVWLDVLTGLTADSTAMPCDYHPHGALTNRVVYRYGPISGNQGLELYDITTGTVVARADSMRPLWPGNGPLVTRGRLVYAEIGNIGVYEAQTLALRGRVVTAGGGRSLVSATLDDRTEALIGATAPPGCPGLCEPNGLIIVDIERQRIAVDQILGTPVHVVR